MNELIGEEQVNTDWLDEKVQAIKGHEFLYNFICFITFRRKKRMRYKDLFLIYYGIHKGNIGEEKAKKKAFKTIIKIYEDNNGKKPEFTN